MWISAHDRKTSSIISKEVYAAGTCSSIQRFPNDLQILQAHLVNRQINIHFTGIINFIIAASSFDWLTEKINLTLATDWNVYFLELSIYLSIGAQPK